MLGVALMHALALAHIPGRLQRLTVCGVVLSWSFDVGRVQAAGVASARLLHAHPRLLPTACSHKSHFVLFGWRFGVTCSRVAEGLNLLCVSLAYLCTLAGLMQRLTFYA